MENFIITCRVIYKICTRGPFLLKIYILDVLKEDNGQRSLILDLHNEHLDQVILHLLDIRLDIVPKVNLDCSVMRWSLFCLNRCGAISIAVPQYNSLKLSLLKTPSIHCSFNKIFTIFLLVSVSSRTILEHSTRCFATSINC